MKDKIDKILKFASRPDHQIIDNGNYNYGKGFDLEVSNHSIDYELSIAVEVDNINEGVGVLHESAFKNKKTREEVQIILEDLTNKAFINPNEKFFIIIKGNKNLRYK